MNIVDYIERVRNGFTEKWTYDLALERLRVLRNKDERQDTGQSIPMACKFYRNRPNQDILAIANEDGQVFLKDTSRNKSKPLYNFQVHNNAVFDMAWSDCKNRLVFGSGDHSASMWDVTESSMEVMGLFVEHKQSIKSVCFRPSSADIFASGGRDGLIMVWDARMRSSVIHVKPENCIVTAHCVSGGTGVESPRGCRKKKFVPRSDSISALLYQDENTLFSCSVSDGLIKVWDMRKCYSTYKRIPQPLYKMEHPSDTGRNCFTSLCLDPSGVRLYANCNDSTVYCYNVSSYSSKPVMTYSGHQVYSLYVKLCLSPDGNYLLSGSSDNRAYVWRTNGPNKPILSLNGHNSEVTYVDWCASGHLKLATCSDDLPDGGSDLAMLWTVFTNDGSMDEHELKNETLGWSEVIRQQVARKPATVRMPGTLKQINEGSSRLEMNSPTSNLPNYVIDGTSPHHRCSSSSKKEQKENRDWLTDLRQKTPTSVNQKSVQIKRRHNGHAKPKACGNLLKFFKVSGNQNIKNDVNGGRCGTSSASY